MLSLIQASMQIHWALFRLVCKAMWKMVCRHTAFCMQTHPNLIQAAIIWFYLKLYKCSPITLNIVFIVSFQCHCPDCHLAEGSNISISSVFIISQEYQTGETIPCLYNPYHAGEVLLKRNSIILVLNAMLWPTIMFITGFVGLFFACLFAQREECRGCKCDRYFFF